MTGGLELGDLWRIRARVVCCTVLVMLALTLALAAHQRLAQARGARLLDEQDLLTAQQKLIRIEDENRVYLARLQRYGEIARRHGAGTERRLEWLAQLRKTAAEHHVSSLEAEFAAQVPLDPGTTRYPELRASRMHLRMGLLHDEDLLGLLADLRRQASAVLHVRSCSIERIPAGHDGDAGEGTAARLRAECSIDWLSLHEQA